MKSGNWLFVSVGGGWMWRRVDPETRDEIARSRVFAVLEHCMADAKRHGCVTPQDYLPQDLAELNGRSDGEVPRS